MLSDYDNCLKVIEVWQGHLNHGQRFKDELNTLSNIYNKRPY